MDCKFIPMKYTQQTLLITIAHVKERKLYTRNYEIVSKREYLRNVHVGQTQLQLTLHGENIIFIIIVRMIKVLEPNIQFVSFVVEARIYIALDLVEQVQIIHQFMKCITPTTLSRKKKHYFIKFLFYQKQIGCNS